MKLVYKLLAAVAVVAAPLVAADASAQTYNITYGSGLNAQITTQPSTGTNLAITGITGTFLGSPITGLVGDPYSPAPGYIYDSTGVVQPTTTYPAGQTGNQYYYSFDNLLIGGNSLDTYGLLFQTATNTVNLYNDGGFSLIYSPTGVNTPATTVAGTFAITPGAVPETATWAMMILGMGAVGFAMRRRQKVATRVSYAA